MFKSGTQATDRFVHHRVRAKCTDDALSVGMIEWGNFSYLGSLHAPTLSRAQPRSYRSQDDRGNKTLPTGVPAAWV